MADTPILRIPVDSSEFDRFMERFGEYKKTAEQSPDPFMRASASLRDASAAMDQLSSEFAALSKAAGTSQMVGNSSFISKWAKNSHDSARDWKDISKSINGSRRDLVNFTRAWSLMKGLRTGLFAAGGAATAIGGATVAAATDLAADNQRNRELNLTPGETPAFNSDFKKYGLSDADIANTVSAQQDPSQWRAFLAAGKSPAEIQHSDPAELLAFMDRWAGGKVREWKSAGLPIATMRKAFGLDNLLSTSQLNLAGSYSDDEHYQSLMQFHADIPKMAVAQKDEDAATDFEQKWSGTMTRVRRDFEKILMPLAPHVGQFATAAADWLEWAGSLKGVRTLVDEFGVSLDKVTTWVASHGKSWDWGHVDHDSSKPILTTGDSDKPWTFDAWLAAIRKNNFGKSHSDSAAASSAPDVSKLPDSIKALSQAAEKRYGLPAGIQQLQIMMESRGNPRAVNPDSGAQGIVQLMPSTSRSMGVDPFNVPDSIDAGAKLLRTFIDKWHGNLGRALANFDGDGHIASDARRYDSWLQGARPETLAYLRRAEDSGFDLNLSPSELSYLNSHTEALAAATHDSKLKKPADTLDLSQARIIDVSKEKPQPQDTSMLTTLSTFARKYLGEGGGAQFSKPEKATTPSGQTAPIKLDVTVNVPAGSSTNVMLNGIPR